VWEFGLLILKNSDFGSLGLYFIFHNFGNFPHAYLNPKTMFFSKKGRTVFSPQNLCMNFEIPKISQNYTFWKLDISTIIFLSFVNLIWDPQEGVLVSQSISGCGTHDPLD